MKFFGRAYQYINILSIDVVLGSVISALFFARLFSYELSIEVLLALALTVWIIYTADHLRDARNIHGIASTDRHRFHQRYFKYIMRVIMCVVVIDVLTISFLPARVLSLGTALGMIVLMYLLLQRYLRFMKEFFVAILYTAGVLMPSTLGIAEEVVTAHYLIIGKFAITALMNLLLFSLMDVEVDRSQNQHSFVTCFGPRAATYAIVFLGIINMISGFWLWQLDGRLAVVFLIMNLTLLTILFLKRGFTHNNYYRMAGDAVFFLPAVFLL